VAKPIFFQLRYGDYRRWLLEVLELDRRRLISGYGERFLNLKGEILGATPSLKKLQLFCYLCTSNNINSKYDKQGS